MSAPAPVILYAEDSEDDVTLMQRVLTKIAFDGDLMVVPHGLEVIDYLSGTGQYGNREKYPLPHLILLDIKMPRLSGLEVLRWIRRQKGLNATPVLMLTSSNQPCDVAAAYAAKADCYLVKPVDMDAFRGLVKDIARLCVEEPVVIDPRTIRGAVPAPESDAP